MMKGLALIGLLVTLAFAPVGRVSAQGESPRDTVEMASDPIVVERDLFTLTLDVGVFVERVCISVEPLRNVCDDILVLLRERGVRSELAEEIRLEMERALREHVIEAMEEWIRQEIQAEIEEQQKMRDATATSPQ